MTKKIERLNFGISDDINNNKSALNGKKCILYVAK